MPYVLGLLSGYRLEDVVEHVLIEAATPNVQLRAKEEFGLTGDPGEAGYVLNDGSMLDFSGKREGGTPGMRSYDHRDISRVTRSGGTPAMLNFMATGAVRFGVYSGSHVTIDVIKPLTSYQDDRLRRMRVTSFVIDVSKKTGIVIWHKTGQSRGEYLAALDQLDTQPWKTSKTKDRKKPAWVKFLDRMSGTGAIQYHNGEWKHNADWGQSLVVLDIKARGTIEVLRRVGTFERDTIFKMILAVAAVQGGLEDHVINDGHRKVTVRRYVGSNKLKWAKGA